jgi:uncharacterized membrane protein (UPF0127 family)
MRVKQRFALAQRAALLMVAASILASPALSMRRENMTLHTARGAQVVSVEITETVEEKAKGLMFRTKLADNEGMLFSYDRPQEITMWMRNTLIPLDMVFIRPNGVVHRIEAWTRPLSEAIVASQGDVSACLELAGGAAERMGLRPGDRIEHAIFASK